MRNPVVALGLGSNLGNSIENLRKALVALKKSGLFKVLDVASIYESDALLPPVSQPTWNKKFLNSVVLTELRRHAEPVDILAEIKRIELSLGREASERWAPRLIDIDVLCWSGGIYKSEQINIPHNSLSERPFALLPLLEVWPDAQFELPWDLPLWAQSYVEKKPFNTIRSSEFFWPKMVGIINITQDSFSDGGQFLTSANLAAQLEKLVKSGVDIVDVGAESTRPGAKLVDAETELKNLNWALSEIKKLSEELNFKIKISLDCRKPWVVERVIEHHKIDYLNDVGGFSDKGMQSLLKNSALPAFVMHSLVVPPQPDMMLPEDCNPFSLLTSWWADKVFELANLGISEDKLVFDMGIGFGKTRIQSMYLLQNLNQFSGIKNDIMIGHSRKSFQTLFSHRPAAERDLETALITQKLNLGYSQYLRVHDVEIQKIALTTKGLMS